MQPRIFLASFNRPRPDQSERPPLELIRVLLRQGPGILKARRPPNDLKLTLLIEGVTEPVPDQPEVLQFAHLHYREADFLPACLDDYVYWQHTNRKIVQRINRLIQACQRAAFEGMGKPEPLKHGLAGYRSRRITDEHRMVYEIEARPIHRAASLPLLTFLHRCTPTSVLKYLHPYEVVCSSLSRAATRRIRSA